MATTAQVRPVHCTTCQQRLVMVICGNLIDYHHPDGSYHCKPVETYRAA